MYKRQPYYQSLSGGFLSGEVAGRENCGLLGGAKGVSLFRRGLQLTETEGPRTPNRPLEGLAGRCVTAVCRGLFSYKSPAQTREIELCSISCRARQKQNTAEYLSTTWRLNDKAREVELRSTSGHATHNLFPKPTTSVTWRPKALPLETTAF